MKKLTSIFIACQLLLLTGFVSSAQEEFTKVDRDKAIDHLKGSQSELLKTVKGLSDEQLNFKPTQEAWSIAECVEHLAISETTLFGAANQSLQADADPSRRSEVQFSDDQILGIITDRTTKIKTRTELEPTNKFGAYDGAVAEFKTKRKESIKFVKSTSEDLRNHYFEFPFGVVDSYQVILFMSGHTLRHTAQIKEIMQQENYPGS